MTELNGRYGSRQAPAPRPRAGTATSRDSRYGDRAAAAHGIVGGNLVGKNRLGSGVPVGLRPIGAQGHEMLSTKIPALQAQPSARTIPASTVFRPHVLCVPSDYI